MIVGIPKCSKDDAKAKRLIKAHSHMAISLNSYKEAQALENVFQGIYDMQRLLETVLPRPGFRQKSMTKVRKELATRISLVAEGLNQYFRHRTRQVEAFACCVETLGFKKTDVHVDIESLKTMVMQGQKLLDQVISDCKDKSVSDSRILEHSKRLQDKIKNGLPQINELTWKIERQLREETEGIIRLCSNSDDDFVSRVAKNLHAYAQDDPVSAGLQ